MSLEPLSLLRPVIEAAERNSHVGPGDYQGEDGLLVCGKCGQKKQEYIRLNPDENVPPIKVPCICQCDIDREKREREAITQREDAVRLKALREDSLMAPKFREATFDNFVVKDFNAVNYRLIHRYATAFDDMLAKNQGLLMWGDTGTGKSFAAGCIANYLLDHGVPVVMTTIMRLTEMMMNREITENELIAKLNRAKLVIFDEFGAERTTEYAVERIYTLIDSRYRRMLPMIITTNLTKDEMLSEGSVKYSRIYDRIFETCYPMHFTGESWRKLAAKKRFDEMEAMLNGK